VALVQLPSTLPLGTAPAQRWKRSFPHCSLDHLIGAGEDRLGDRDAERLRGLQIDDQLEFSRPLDGQVGGSRSLQNARNIWAAASIAST
jgi:hypothetical protein